MSQETVGKDHESRPPTAAGKGGSGVHVRARQTLPTARPAVRPSSAERRRRILEAATGLFQSAGFIGTTTDDIAVAAGLTKRTIYKYMGSKGRILMEIHEQFIAEGQKRWSAVVARGGSPSERLRGLIVEQVRVVAEFQPAIQVFFEEMKHLAPEEKEIIVVQRQAYETVLRDVLDAGMQSGEFRRLDLPVTTKAVLGALNELYRWFRTDGAMSADEIGSFVADQFLTGLSPRAAATRAGR